MKRRVGSASAVSKNAKDIGSAGAKRSHITIAQRLAAYLKDHQRVLVSSFKRLLADPLNCVMTWAVIGIALALPVGLYVALGNVQALGNRWEGSAQISLFLQQSVSELELQRLVEELQIWPEVEELHSISKEEALLEFQSLSGFSEALVHVEQNPLPHVIELLPVESHSHTEAIEELLDKLQQLPLVDIAQLDLEWVQRLAAMLDVGQRLALGLVVLLSLAVLLVVGNTIRLEIESRRDEIVVSKLVGATDAFVRRPLLYTGVWYGLGGGVIASIVVAIGLVVLNGPVVLLVGLYQSDYYLLGLTFGDTLSLWLMAALLGYGGAWFSVSKHLDALQPR